MIMLSLGVTACGDTSTDEVTQISGEESAAVTASETSASTGTIVTSVGRYIFKPTNCAIGVEQGIKDIEIGGPGANPDGKPIYVTYSSTADSLDIQLGVDKPSASSEHELVAGRSVTQPIELSVSGQTVRATGISIANGRREIIDTEASFQVDCRPPI